MNHYHCASRDPIERLVHALRALPPGLTEMAFHPGFDDPDSLDSLEYRLVRQNDYALLTHPAVRDTLRQEKIYLISYGDVYRN